MEIEYEATFPNIDKDEVRTKLRNSGAVLKRPEYLQRRVVFSLPKERADEGGLDESARRRR